MNIDRLNAMMKVRDVGPVKLAEAAGVTREYIWALRKGQNPNVSAVVVAKIAECLGVSVDYLLGVDREDALRPELVPLVERLKGMDMEQVKALAVLLGVDITYIVQPWRSYTQENGEEPSLAELLRREIDRTTDAALRARLESMLEIIESNAPLDVEIQRIIDRLRRREGRVVADEPQRALAHG